MTVYSLSLQISPALKNRARESPVMSAKSLRPGQSLIFSLRHGHCVFLKVFGSGQSDVRSGTSMPPCCVVNAIILYTLIHWIIQHRSRANSRLSEGRKSHVLSCNIDYPDPLTGQCSRSPRNT